MTNYPLSDEKNQLISAMENAGAKLKDDYFIIFTKEQLNSFIKANPEAYEIASMQVPPTSKQIELCEEIINKGVSYHNDIFEKMGKAYEFIGENRSHISSWRTKRWAARTTMTPEEYGVPNH